MRLGVLPGFVTADWLADNHHLMKADLRRLAAAVAEDYPDWPAAVDGSDEAAFWKTVHAYAGRWTWFLWLFEERIVKLLGRVKGGRKQLLPRVLKSAGDRARKLRPVARGEAEPSIMDDLDTLWEAGEHVRVAEAVWVLSCLDDPSGRMMVSGWLGEPEIEDLVGPAVRHAGGSARAVRRDLVERLHHEAAGPHLERLTVTAGAECAALEQEMADRWDRLRKLAAEHAAYLPVSETVSLLLLDLELSAGELEEMEAARGGALARCRHVSLRALLEGTLDAMPGEEFGKEGEGLKRRVETILKDDGFPFRLPDREWERCKDLAERFRAAVVEPGEHEIALREAAERYARDPSAREPRRPARGVRRRARASPVERTGGGGARRTRGLSRRARRGLRHGGGSGLAWWRRSIRTARSAQGSASSRRRTAMRRRGSRHWSRPLGMPAGRMTNCGERRHRLLQRLAALEGGEPAQAADRTAVPPLPGYAELPAWVEEHFGGRIALAGRALRALKGAGFEDVALVGNAIELLATSYRQMKSEGGSELRDAFEDRLRALRLQETPSLSPTGQGRARDDYVVEWDGRRFTLDRHLKNNAKTRDPRQCFRLYFAWDEASRQVVIGHLPGHMKI